MNSVLVEGVDNVRNAVYSHFSTHLQRRLMQRPSMDSLPFLSLSTGEGAALTRPFSMDEVRRAVWDCENYKSPGPDGINFGFIKEFWDIMKEDVMRFIVKFHQNGRLARGINSTFIALIPRLIILNASMTFDRYRWWVVCTKFWLRCLLIDSVV